MALKEGDRYINANGVEFVVTKIINRMAVLLSSDGKRQILTDIGNLKIGFFYQKVQTEDSPKEVK